jgi:hypothetical protein
MDRIYLIIFLVLIGAFIYWYQKNILKFKYNKSKKKKRTKSKSRKLKKKSKLHRSKKLRNHDTEESDRQLDTESTDSKITKKKDKLKKAYHKSHGDTPSLDSLSMGGNSRGTHDSGDYSLDSASSSDFLSRGK